MSRRTGTATFEALGTTAQATVTAPELLDDAVSMVLDELRAIDETCSRFSEDSELARLQRAEGSPMVASPLLREALTVAVHAAATTGGAVDPTVGSALSGLGWDLDFAVVAARHGPMRILFRPAAGWRTIRIDRRAGTIQVPAGVELDLGSTAKALAADRSARKVHEATGIGVLIALGGDIAVAGEPPAEGWIVRVTDDHREGASTEGQTVALAAGGLATSSTTVRRWRAGGKEQHHIVDPCTGQPVREVWRTASVAARSCVDANTASTAAIVQGREAPRQLARRGLAARLVAANGRVQTVGAWPNEGE